MTSEFTNAEWPIDIEKRTLHLKCRKGDLSEHLLLPGDQKRAEMIAKSWDSYKEVANHRQFHSYRGNLNNKDLSALSSGIGPSAVEIAMNELSYIGVKTLIRVGSTGAISKDCRVGDLIISTGALRRENASDFYTHPSFPAIADYEVVLALIGAAEELDMRYHVGLTASNSNFYVGQGRKTHSGFLPKGAENLIEELSNLGVLNLEMEASTIFVLAQLFKIRAGAICTVFANRITNEFGEKGEQDAIDVANLALCKLIDMEKIKQEHGKKYWTPDLSL